MTAEEIATILTAVGAGALVKEALQYAWKSFTGRARNNQQNQDRLYTEKVRAEDERDASDTLRRLTQEDNSELRRIVIEKLGREHLPPERPHAINQNPPSP